MTDTIYGRSIAEARRFFISRDASFTANNTTTYLCGGVPAGLVGKIRILGVYVCCNAVPSDADGTLLANFFIKDASEVADDQMVTSQDLETLVTVANRWFALTLAAESSEKELTVEAGDAFRFTVVSNSAAIDTNPQTQFMVEYIPLPTQPLIDGYDTDVKYQSAY